MSLERKKRGREGGGEVREEQLLRENTVGGAETGSGRKEGRREGDIMRMWRRKREVREGSGKQGERSRGKRKREEEAFGDTILSHPRLSSVLVSFPLRSSPAHLISSSSLLFVSHRLSSRHLLSSAHPCHPIRHVPLRHAHLPILPSCRDTAACGRVVFSCGVA